MRKYLASIFNASLHLAFIYGFLWMTDLLDRLELWIGIAALLTASRALVNSQPVRSEKFPVTKMRAGESAYMHSGGVAKTHLRDDEVAVQVTNWDTNYPRPKKSSEEFSHPERFAFLYTCPVCGSHDKHRYTRCNHAGCPDGRDPR